MTAGQPTVGIFSPIGPSTAPSARAASGVSVRPSGGISTGATRCGPGRLARRAYGSGVRYTVIYQATCADICPLFRSERTERLQYLTPMAMRNAIGRAKLHGRPPALPSARSPTPCRVPSPPRRLTRRPSPPQPPAAPWRSPTSSSNRRPRGLREHFTRARSCAPRFFRSSATGNLLLYAPQENVRRATAFRQLRVHVGHGSDTETPHRLTAPTATDQASKAALERERQAASPRQTSGNQNHLFTKRASSLFHVQIEGKRANIVQTPNRLHVMMASNERWVVAASIDSRRYFSSKCPTRGRATSPTSTRSLNRCRPVAATRRCPRPADAGHQRFQRPRRADHRGVAAAAQPEPEPADHRGGGGVAAPKWSQTATAALNCTVNEKLAALTYT